MSQPLNWMKHGDKKRVCKDFDKNYISYGTNECPIVARVMGRLLRFCYAGRIPPGKRGFANNLCKAYRNRKLSHKQYVYARKLCKDHGGENKWRTIGHVKRQQQQHIG